MKTTITTFAVVAVTAILGVSAQAQMRAGIVAVLDVAEVFKDNKGFNTQLNAIRSEAKQLNDGFQLEMKQLQEKVKTMATMYNAGSPERKAKETSLAQEQARTQTNYRQANEELLNREARLYFRTYQQLQTVVAQLANEHNISMVLRYDRSEVNPDVRPEVVKVVNRAVVYQRELDLTDMVKQRMGPSMTAGNPGNQQR